MKSDFSGKAAWGDYNYIIYPQFEGDYITYDLLPAVRDSVLTLSGKVMNGLRLREPNDLQVNIFYDPPPHGLTFGNTWLYIWIRMAAIPMEPFYKTYLGFTFSRSALVSASPFECLSVPVGSSLFSKRELCQ